MIIPLLHRVLVKQDQLDEKDKDYKRAKESGIVIPKFDEKVREQAAIDTGVVVDVGPTAFKDFNAVGAVEIGDHVVFAKHAGKIIVDPDTEEQFVCLNDEDLVAKIKKGA